MIRLLTTLPAFLKAIMPGMEISLVESHQHSKVDTSGTARLIAKMIGLPTERIKSIRDRDIQLSYGVPDEHLDGHAYHDIILTGQGVDMIRLSTRIHNSDTYIEGALTIARILVTTLRNVDLPPGVYTPQQIIDLSSSRDRY